MARGEAIFGPAFARRIAGMLYLSRKTVQNHASSMFTKLRVAARAGAMVTARRQGIGVRPLDEG